MRSAVFIETRNFPDMCDVINGHLQYLDDSFRLVVFGSENIKNTILLNFPECIFIDIEDQSIVSYNKMLTTKDFWNKIPDEDILIFQYDSMLLKSGIEKFFQWDYVGAPWEYQEHGGNGGLSIRKKSVMLKCIDAVNFEDQQYNEDMYFCNTMLFHNIGTMAPREVCSEFSVETIFRLGTYGYHNIGTYHTKEDCDKIKDQYNVWIIGKGPSIKKLRRHHIGNGLVIALNSSIKIVEDLRLQNEIISLQKDGPSPHSRNKCPSMNCRKCPYDMVYPRRATLYVHKNESLCCLADYSPRIIFDTNDYGLNAYGLTWNTESVRVAIEIAISKGCNKFNFIGFDSMLEDYSNYDSEETDYSRGVLMAQKERLMDRVRTLNHKFIVL